MSRVTHLTLMSLILGGCLSAHALSWQELEKKALESNPEIQSLRSSTKALEYQRSGAYSTYWPQFNLFAEQTRQDGRENFAVLDPLTNTISLTSNKKYVTVDSYGFKTTWNLFRGFSTEANVEFNTAGLEAGRNQLSLKSIDLRYNLRRAYIEYIMAQKSLKTSQKIRNQQKRNRDLIKIKYDSGLEAAWALDQADAALQLADLRLELDQENLKQSAETVSLLIDSPVPVTIDSEEPTLEPLPELSASVLDEHPQVQYQNQQLRQAYAERKLARAEFYPSLDANYAWAHSKEKDEDGGEQNSVSLTLTWNIFDGFSSRAKVGAARARQIAAELNERSVRDQLRLDLQQQTRNYNLNLKNVTLKKAELKAAVLRSETVSNQYRNGLRKYQDWESAEIRLIDLEREMVRVERDTLLLRAAWERTVGRKLGDL